MSEKKDNRFQNRFNNDPPNEGSIISPETIELMKETKKTKKITSEQEIDKEKNIVIKKKKPVAAKKKKAVMFDIEETKTIQKSIYFTTNQLNVIELLAKANKTSVSKIVSKIVDKFIEENDL